MPIDRRTLPERMDLWPTSALIEALVETAVVTDFSMRPVFGAAANDILKWRNELRLEIDRRIPVPL